VEDHRTSISWWGPLTTHVPLVSKDPVKVGIVFKRFPGVNRNAAVGVGCNVMSWGTKP
jgi:hypothetical protein